MAVPQKLKAGESSRRGSYALLGEFGPVNVADPLTSECKQHMPIANESPVWRQLASLGSLLISVDASSD